MTRVRGRWWRGAVSTLLVGQCWLLAGCDLIDDATSFTLCTGEEQFSLDSAQLGFSGTGTTVPSIPCDDAVDPCQQASALFSCAGSGVQCTARCASGTGSSRTCELEAVVERVVSIDLSGQVSGQTAGALSSVTLQEVQYWVPTNTLNVDTPQIRFFVADGSAESAGDSSAVLLGLMPSIPAGATNADRQVLPIEAGGQQQLVEFVRDYRNPFRIIARTSLLVRAEQDVPAGAIDLRLRACFKAELL